MPPHKKPRLLDFTHMPGRHVSGSALSSLLDLVRTHGLPAAYSRGQQYKNRKTFCNQRTPYGRLVDTFEMPLANGSVMQCAVQSPLPVIWLLAKSCEHFAALMEYTLVQCPRLWNIILYNDGVSPNDGLSKHDGRKLTVVYFSFWEFGMQILSQERAWFVLSSIRTDELRKIDGGLSHYVEKILSTFVFNPQGHHLERAGMELELRERRFYLRARVGILLSDIPALADLLLCKGHAGLKCCPLCKNVLLHSLAKPADLASGYCVTHACMDPDKFDLHTDLSIQGSMSRLQAQAGGNALPDLEIIHGYNYNAFSILLSTNFTIGVATSIMFDWMHNTVEGGLLDKEFGLCMAALHRERSPTTYKTLERFIKFFKFPKHLPRVAHLFDKLSCAKYIRNEAFSCSASELMTLAPVLELYFMTFGLVQGYCTDHIHCILALLTVMSLLDAIKWGVVTPDDLADAIQHHGALFVACYGESLARPKHHYTQHLPAIFRRWDGLLSCWVQERLHRLVKRFAASRRT